MSQLRDISITLDGGVQSFYGDLFLNRQTTMGMFSNREELQSSFELNHYLVFPGLLSDSGLVFLQHEMQRMQQDAVRKDFQMDCMDSTPRRMTTLGADVIDRLSSAVSGIYSDPAFLDLMSAVYGEQLVPLTDDIDRYVLNILKQGNDTFGGHFDDYPVSVVLIIEAPSVEFGGFPQLVPRATSLKELGSDNVIDVALSSGDVYMLKADTTAHRVSPLRADVNRIAINLAYTTPSFRPDFTPSASLLYSRESITSQPQVLQSFNEWDPLEEVIVGVANGAIFPAEARQVIEATMPEEHWDEFTKGNPFPSEIISAADEELNQFANILESLGVVVRRPDHVDWMSRGGHTTAMARDPLLVVGSTVIEAPMAWSSRQQETLPYRRLIAEYVDGGGKWVSAPRVLDPDLLIRDEEESGILDGNTWIINNSQPAFDAADFLRFGRDIVGQLSHVTNAAGVEWLQQLLGNEFKVHTLTFDDPHAVHIDASIMPLQPGLLLFNPERVSASYLRKTLFSRWELVPTPTPTPRTYPPLFMTSGWVNMNLLVVDGKRVFVEADDKTMQNLLSSLGMTPIPCPFQHVQSLGGSFHCATLDIRRRGVLETYV